MYGFPTQCLDRTSGYLVRNKIPAHIWTRPDWWNRVGYIVCRCGSVQFISKRVVRDKNCSVRIVGYAPSDVVAVPCSWHHINITTTIRSQTLVCLLVLNEYMRISRINDSPLGKFTVVTCWYQTDIVVTIWYYFWFKLCLKFPSQQKLKKHTQNCCKINRYHWYQYKPP